MENTDISAKTARTNGADLTPYQFKPGQTGNAGGRPHDPLKAFQREQFAKMSTKEKAEFLKKVQALDRWKMAEGNPHQTNETELKGEVHLHFHESFKKHVRPTSGTIESN